MFTVFVIGAGAGVAYGLPTAGELKQQIIDSPPVIVADFLSADPAMRPYVESQARQLAHQLSHSPRPSIDSFLEQHPGWADTGKRMIAKIIGDAFLKAAKGSTLVQNWHSHVFHSVFTAARRGRESDGYAFVTFNYDQSLELAAYRMWRSEGLDGQQAEHRVNKDLQLIHMYGQLWLPTTVTDNGYLTPRMSEADLVRVAKGIHTTDVERAPSEEKARDLMLKADRIVFLGFGYDETNLRRLGIGTEEWKQHSPPILLGTAYKVYRAERERVKEIMAHRIEFGGDNQEVLPFLRDLVAI